MIFKIGKLRKKKYLEVQRAGVGTLSYLRRWRKVRSFYLFIFSYSFLPPSCLRGAPLPGSGAVTFAPTTPLSLEENRRCASVLSSARDRRGSAPAAPQTSLFASFFASLFPPPFFIICGRFFGFFFSFLFFFFFIY